jgi:hypothetical protein
MSFIVRIDAKSYGQGRFKNLQCGIGIIDIEQSMSEISHRVEPSKIRLRPPDERLPARPPECALHDTVVVLPAQATRLPSIPPRNELLNAKVILLGLGNQKLRLLRQARHVREALRGMARAPAHEAFSRALMDRISTNVARLALRIIRIFPDRDRDGLLVLFVGVILFSAASLLDLFA